MRVLFVCSRPLQINTSSSIRNKAFVQGLINNGCIVDMATCRPDEHRDAFDSSLGISGINKFYYYDTKKQDTIRKVFRLNPFFKKIKKLIYSFYKNNHIYDNTSSFANNWKELHINYSQYDILISSSDPKTSHLFLFNAIGNDEELSRKWIQIWGDPFASDITVKANNKKKKRIMIEEKKLISKPKCVYYVSRLTMENLKSIYPEFSSKMKHIPVPYLAKKEYEINNNSVQRILLYSGDYSKDIRNLLPLVNAIERINGYKLIICGSGDIDFQQSKNVIVYPRLSLSKLDKLEETADVLVHLSNKRGTQIPGKIYHYSATNKEIMFILDGDKESLYNEFKKYNRYSFVDNEEQAICSYLEQLSQKHLENNSPVADFECTRVVQTVLSELDKE